MTDEQARRIAQLNARRSQAKPGWTASRAQAGKTAGTARAGKQHRARKSRALVLGLSVATSAGLVSGMWTQAALANNQQVDSTALQPDPTPQTTTTAPSDVTLQPNQTLVPVVIPGQHGQPDQIVYLVVTQPSSSPGADSLRSNTSSTQTQVPSQAVTPATPRPTIQTPVTRSHGSR